MYFLSTESKRPHFAREETSLKQSSIDSNFVRLIIRKAIVVVKRWIPFYLYIPANVPSELS